MERACMGDLQTEAHNEGLFINLCKCSIVKGRVHKLIFCLLVTNNISLQNIQTFLYSKKPVKA